ncbi:MAG TPA: hypothetical protein VMZ28_31120 [Kofleriaceae bacterium]|nr:hypothetical protein [Kofleriaceae bacterium]
MRAVLIAALLLVACNERASKGEGEACFASSECGANLVCDFGADPHVCASMGTPGDDPGGGADASNVPAPDADPNAPDAGATPVFDAAPPPPIDAAPIDAMPPI